MDTSAFAKVYHYISHIAGIVLNFNKKKIAQPPFTSQDTSLKIPSTHNLVLEIWDFNVL
jgi:hypothetical protein